MAKQDPEGFAALFARSEMPKARARRYAIGDEVEGLVGHVSSDAVFVDLDAKQQGWFDRIELGEVAVGDRVKGRVIAIEDAGVKLAKGFGKDAGRAELQLAFEQGVPVEGKVLAINKGGAEVEVAGARGFCPLSQLDRRYVEDPASYVGRSYSFLVTELKDRDVVLSRRQLLEREARQAREALYGKLQVGVTMSGRVTQIREFGAFVDLGGVEGLVPMRELSHDRVESARDVLAVGDVVSAKITKVEPDGDRLKISLSLKALAADPWEGIEAVAPIGQVLAGQVTRITEFGAFVRLGPGVEGLLHVSELGARMTHASEGAEVGQQVLVVARSIDPAKRRISLALAPPGAQVGAAGGARGPVYGAVVRATVEKHENFGVFAQIEGTRGRAGRALIPTSELGIARGADARKELPIGTVVSAKVVDATEGRTRLSIRAAHDDAERAVFDSYRQEQAPKGSMGTLGDLLRAKLSK
ncbi:MAG: S1 RNA-binding domain-containing protein [Sandaracinaceae bacterium]|nr:S1 RNA-binding domain-containing protein [Sandaracinaceae bacterium]